jgi:hypothetical protein
MYLVDQMRDVAALAEPFEGPHAGYNADDPHFVRVYCQLEPPPAA